MRVFLCYNEYAFVQHILKEMCRNHRYEFRYAPPESDSSHELLVKHCLNHSLHIGIRSLFGVVTTTDKWIQSGNWYKHQHQLVAYVLYIHICV